MILGRRGTSLLSGEDYEISFVAIALGLGFGRFPELKLTHLIPGERVSADYLVRLREGISASVALLDYKWAGKTPRNYRTAIGLLTVLAKSLLLRGVSRRIYLAEVRGKMAASRIVKSLAK